VVLRAAFAGQQCAPQRQCDAGPHIPRLCQSIATNSFGTSQCPYSRNVHTHETRQPASKLGLDREQSISSDLNRGVRCAGEGAGYPPARSLMCKVELEYAVWSSCDFVARPDADYRRGVNALLAQFPREDEECYLSKVPQNTTHQP
jgi:hypothetical protein